MALWKQCELQAGPDSWNAERAALPSSSAAQRGHVPAVSTPPRPNTTPSKQHKHLEEHPQRLSLGWNRSGPKWQAVIYNKEGTEHGLSGDSSPVVPL